MQIYAYSSLINREVIDIYMKKSLLIAVVALALILPVSAKETSSDLTSDRTMTESDNQLVTDQTDTNTSESEKILRLVMIQI